MEQGIKCIGCRLANNDLPTNIVYENEYVTCILDHEPFNDGHTLILTKKHFKDVDELDHETATSIMNASILISKALKNLYKPDGITVTQNSGMFNDLTHYHMHIVPRFLGQSFADFYIEDDSVEEGIKDLFQTRNLLIEAINKLV